ncbi:hypothetical protein MKZ02_12660 [Pseudobacillus sp. FSL P4-0506]|uniref:hypothetical protein n=1 Tax=Pseudobacillus sp. FSL P4-0506 TaxID=2921576 RepID=UPI0030FB04F4
MEQQFDYSKVIVDLIQSNIKGIFAGIYSKGGTKYKELMVKTGFAFEDYLNKSVQKFNMVKTIIYSHKPMPLYQFYVNLDVKCGYDVISTENIEDLLSYSNFITIFGTGGTGKSTLFKHLFLDTLRSTNFIP